MTPPTPWWTPETATLIGAFGGGGLGLLGALLGTLSGILVPRGKGKPFVLTLFALFIFVGAGTLPFGIIALVDKQPYHVWYPLTLIGFICLAVGLPLFFVMRARYRAMEQKRMDAEIFRTS